MQMKLVPATPEDAEAVASLRTRAATHLALSHGPGPWAREVSGKDVLARMSKGKVFLVRHRQGLIATLGLTTTKPRAIDVSNFRAVRLPIYLVDMAVDPEHQGRGIGRWCLGEVEGLVRSWSGEAVRLDAYEGQAGASGFYRRCGYREVGRAVFRQVPLVYFESILGVSSSS